MRNTPKTIADLVEDPDNARKHDARNIDAIASTLRAVGAARSIVIDENNVLLAGAGTVRGAKDAGITKVHVVEADGQTLVAVRRSGLTEAEKRHLAIADNRTAELAEWDTEVLGRLAESGDIPPGLFDERELDELLGQTGDSSDERARPFQVPKPTDVVWVLMAVPLEAWSEVAPTLRPVFERADVAVQTTRAAEPSE